MTPFPTFYRVLEALHVERWNSMLCFALTPEWRMKIFTHVFLFNNITILSNHKHSAVNSMVMELILTFGKHIFKICSPPCSGKAWYSVQMGNRKCSLPILLCRKNHEAAFFTRTRFSYTFKHIFFWKIFCDYLTIL